MKTSPSVFVFLIILALVSVPASADPTQCNAASGFSGFASSLDLINGSNQTGPFGTVCVVLNSSTQARVTFTSENGYLFVGVGAANVNVNASTFTEANSEELLSSTDITSTTFKQFSSGNADGWGSFNLNLDFKDASHPADTIIFTVTNTASTWSLANQVLSFNASGHDAAAHVLEPNSGGLTFYAAEDAGGTITGGPVPEPNLVLLSLIVGVVAILVSRRRRQET